MDFNYLIELAKANEERDKKDSSIKFSTCVPNAKKVPKAGPKVDAIKKVLSRKEDDKKKQDIEYQEKRAKLLALRAQDKKSNKRVLAMINRTKGASKSVLEDAKDITTAIGEEQCDEDDYGYESTFSQQIFAKLKNNYSEIPEDERLKFSKIKKSNIDDIKSRVLSSLKQEQEENLGIRKRKRNRKKSVEDDGFINDGDVYKKFEHGEESTVEEAGKKVKKKSKSESKMPVNLNVTNYKSDKYSQFKYKKDPNKEEKSSKDESKNKKKGAPPPMSFEELMKVAVNKVSQPLPVEDPLLILKKKKKEKEKELENERPLTAKEKKELAEEKLRKLKQAWKLSGAEKETAEMQKLKNELEIKCEGKNENQVQSSKGPKSEGKKLYEALTAKPVKDRSRFFAAPAPVNSKDNVQKSNSTTTTLDKRKPAAPLPPKLNNTKATPVQNSAKKSITSNLPKKEGILPVESGKIVKKSSNASSNKSLSFPPKLPIKKPAAPISRRIDSDEDSEYDSEMDDFIDDGDVELDYSSEIAKMFNYDKSKYRGKDEDIDDMEASYTQVEKEERISAKLGLKEDLEDIEREDREKKRKKMLLKTKGKLK